MQACNELVLCFLLLLVHLLPHLLHVAPSSAAVGLCMYDDGTLVHDACSNSWSDTGSAQVPGEKEGQRLCFRSGRRFTSCLRGGGRSKFSAGRRCTGAGCRFTSQESTSDWYQAAKGRCGHTFPPPEVLGSQFASPGRGLGIRQSMGWTKVCETARSGNFGC